MLRAKKKKIVFALILSSSSVQFGIKKVMISGK